jgi:hypothetical protein
VIFRSPRWEGSIFFTKRFCVMVAGSSSSPDPPRSTSPWSQGTPIVPYRKAHGPSLPYMGMAYFTFLLYFEFIPELTLHLTLLKVSLLAGLTFERRRCVCGPGSEAPQVQAGDP